MSSAWGRLLCLILLLEAPGALAQTVATPPVATSRSIDPVYDGLIEKAIAEFNLGHWGEAKAFFMRAHQRRPNARTLRSLGFASYEQRLYVDAIGYLRQALTSQEQPLTPELRAHVERQLAEARSFVTCVTLVLEPASVAFHVDGHEPSFDDDGSLLLDPGLHELAADAPNYEPQVRTVTAHGAERIGLTFSLGMVPTQVKNEPPPLPVEPLSIEPEPTDSVPPPSPQPVQAPVTASPSTAQWVGIGLGAAGVVAGGVALGFSLVASHDNSVSKRTCTATTCDAAGRDARKSALAHADVATMSVIAAGALLAAGVFTYFAAPSGERAATSWRVSPVASPQAAGMIVMRQF